MVRLLGSSRSSRHADDSGNLARQLTKRFRLCFGPPESPPLQIEREPLAVEDRVAPNPGPDAPHPRNPELPEECRTSFEEGTSKNSELLSDLSDGQIELDSLERTEANFTLLVAECHRLRSEKHRLQHMLLDFDGQMVELTRECEEILKTTNQRFEQALRSVRYMDTVVRSLREELDTKVHSNTELELQRKVMQHQLSHAMRELRSSVGVARVKEALLAPTF